jgi:hypothetical protein
MTCESLLIICNKSTRERQTGEEEEEEAATRGERERETTNEPNALPRKGRREVHQLQTRLLRAFFQVSTACEKKTNGQRRTPTVI